MLECSGRRQPSGLAFVTGSAERVARVTPALQDEGFATHSAASDALDELERIQAVVPAGSLDCYVQLPTMDSDRNGGTSVAGLRALVANALLARLDALAVVAGLLAPAGQLVIVAGDRAGTVRDTDLGLPDISVVLAEAVLASKGAHKVHVTVVRHDRTAADIATIARGRTATASPGDLLAGFAALSPGLSFVEWRAEVLNLATELDYRP